MFTTICHHNFAQHVCILFSKEMLIANWLQTWKAWTMHRFECLREFHVFLVGKFIDGGGPGFPHPSHIDHNRVQTKMRPYTILLRIWFHTTFIDHYYCLFSPKRSPEWLHYSNRELSLRNLWARMICLTQWCDLFKVWCVSWSIVYHWRISLTNLSFYLM